MNICQPATTQRGNVVAVLWPDQLEDHRKTLGFLSHISRFEQWLIMGFALCSPISLSIDFLLFSCLLSFWLMLSICLTTSLYFFLLTHSSSQPQYKYNVICLMYSVILLSWQSILFCGNTIGMYLLWSVAWGHFQICCSAMETYGANYKLIMKRPSGNRLEA